MVRRGGGCGGGGEAAGQQVGAASPGGLGSLWFGGSQGKLPPLCMPQKDLAEEPGRRWRGGGSSAACPTAGKLRQSHRGQDGGALASWLGIPDCGDAGMSLPALPQFPRTPPICASRLLLPSPECLERGRGAAPLPRDPQPLPPVPMQCQVLGCAPAWASRSPLPPSPSARGRHPPHRPCVPCPRAPLSPFPLVSPLPLPAPFISSFPHSFSFLPRVQ